jgi:hypothetical protein
MTLDEYLVQHLDSVVMITLSTDEKEVFQYNHWNYLMNTMNLNDREFHLLNDDYTLGHILYSGGVTVRENGAVVYTSSKNYKPKNVVLNFYFGGATP